MPSTTTPPQPPTSNALALSLILAHIASSPPGSLSSRNQQTAYLNSLTSKHRFAYFSSTYGHTVHDAKSLRAALVAILRNYGQRGSGMEGKGKVDVQEFFEKGREVLERGFVAAVEEAAAADLEMEGTEGGGSEGEEEVDIDGTGEVVDEREERRIRAILEDSHSSDEEYEPGRERRRRKKGRGRKVRRRGRVVRSVSIATSAECEDGEREDGEREEVPTGLETGCERFASALNAGRSLSQGPDCSPPACYDGLDGFISRDLPDGRLSNEELKPRSCKRKLSYVQLQDDSGNEGDDERQMSISCERMRPKRRRAKHSRSPRLATQQHVEDDEASTAADDDKPIKTEYDDADLEHQPHVADDIHRRIQALNDKVESVVLTLFAIINLDPSRSADLVLDPNTNLRALYTQVLGGSGWKHTAFHLKSQHCFLASDILRSLISAFLTNHILNADIPWASTLSLLATDTPFQKYAVPLLKSVDTRALLYEAETAQLRDGEFLDSEVRPRARGFAADLRLVVHDHLDLLIQGTELWHETLTQGLQKICEAALELRGWVEVLGGRAVWEWYGCGETLEGQEVAFTVFPRLSWPCGSGEAIFPGVVVAL